MAETSISANIHVRGSDRISWQSYNTSQWLRLGFNAAVFFDGRAEIEATIAALQEGLAALDASELRMAA